MVPNADRDKETSIPINQATFLMTNMLAQAPDNNQGPWAAFENYLRTLLPSDEIYIVAGGAGTGGTGSNGGLTTTIANGHVTVPAFTWKVALVIPKGVGDVYARQLLVADDRGDDAERPGHPERSVGELPDDRRCGGGADRLQLLLGAAARDSRPASRPAINGNNPPLDTTPPAISVRGT